MVASTGTDKAALEQKFEEVRSQVFEKLATTGVV
jgi:hypothetical protein